MKHGKWLIVIGGVILAAYILLVVLNHPSYRSPAIMELNRAASVRIGLQEYAQQHDGRFPRTLDEMDPAFFPPNARQFHDPVTKRAADWIYYKGYTLADVPGQSPARNISLSSPSMVNGHQRIVVYDNATAEIMEENNFVLRLSRQLDERRQ